MRTTSKNSSTLLSWPIQILQRVRIALCYLPLVVGCSSVTERRNVTVLETSKPNSANPYLLTPEQERDVKRKQREHKQQLRVPRRPPWTREMTKEDLERSERDSFLEWRRGLAECVAQFEVRKALKRDRAQTQRRQRTAAHALRTQSFHLATALANTRAFPSHCTDRRRSQSAWLPL